MRGRGREVSPLPQRDGVDAVRVRLPVSGPWATVVEGLAARVPSVGAARWESLVRRGAVVGADGRPVGVGSPFVAGMSVWFYRELPEEPVVPFPMSVVYRDERVVVVDKPHFLATIPRGSHVAETALVRLRRELGLPGLSPAHRLDRMTAGLVLFVVRPQWRGAYQVLFRDRRVGKEYLAVAPVVPGVGWPAVVRSRIVKERGVHAAREVGGVPNAVTRVELVGVREGVGLYRLRPETGRTHQLRVHMARLGAPILGDDLFPVVAERAVGDFSRPLQLLARVLEFVDPVSGVARRFESRLRLSAWESPSGWAAAGG